MYQHSELYWQPSIMHRVVTKHELGHNHDRRIAKIRRMVQQLLVVAILRPVAKTGEHFHKLTGVQRSNIVSVPKPKHNKILVTANKRHKL
jgi:hypothetical protein